MHHLFTSESVSEGHPDKISDQISDAIVDHFLAYDPNSKVACETLVTTGQVILSGEVSSEAYLDFQEIVREVIRRIGYTESSYKFDADSCGILSAIQEQSPDIRRGVERSSPEEQGAGDQGMMFGYATNETKNYMPLGLSIAHAILRVLADIRKSGNSRMDYLRPDAKSQVTIEYADENKPKRIDSIVVSTQHDPFHEDDVVMQERIRKDILEIVMPEVIAGLNENIKELFNDQIRYYINPTGRFVIGGPHGDTGLTGRKIIVDTYGGKGAHGGGAFSGKDPSKVDRSGAYAARHIAKNMVAAGLCDEVLVQISYAIGLAEPCGFYIDTYHSSHVDFTDNEIAKKIFDMFDLRPYALERTYNLRSPIYEETAAYGHMGRTPMKKIKVFNKGKANEKTVEVELFTWEKLDRVDDIKKAFGLS